MMKLGTETGSLTNHVMSRMTVGQPAPEVGMGATLLGWTDRHAATVVEVGKIITVQLDRAERTDQNVMSECQEYHYSANPAGARYHFRQSKGGAWEEVHRGETGRWKKTGGYGLRLGERAAYHDFSF